MITDDECSAFEGAMIKFPFKLYRLINLEMSLNPATFYPLSRILMLLQLESMLSV